MIVFVVAFKICLVILIAVVIFQFVYYLLNGEQHGDVNRFAAHLGTYLKQVVAYLTMTSDYKPFPFADWPPGEESVDGTASETTEAD